MPASSRTNADTATAWGRFKLIAKENVEESDHLYFYQAEHRIGRLQSHSDILLTPAFVSGLHCIVQMKHKTERDLEFCIQDFSRNGIYVNEEFLGKNKERVLMPNDIVHFTRPGVQSKGFEPVVYQFETFEAAPSLRLERQRIEAELNELDRGIRTPKKALKRKSHIEQSPEQNVDVASEVKENADSSVEQVTELDELGRGNTTSSDFTQVLKKRKYTDQKFEQEMNVADEVEVEADSASESKEHAKKISSDSKAMGEELLNVTSVIQKSNEELRQKLQDAAEKELQLKQELREAENYRDQLEKELMKGVTQINSLSNTVTEQATMIGMKDQQLEELKQLNSKLESRLFEENQSYTKLLEVVAAAEQQIGSHRAELESFTKKLEDANNKIAALTAEKQNLENNQKQFELVDQSKCEKETIRLTSQFRAAQTAFEKLKLNVGEIESNLFGTDCIQSDEQLSAELNTLLPSPLNTDITIENNIPLHIEEKSSCQDLVIFQKCTENPSGEESLAEKDGNDETEQLSGGADPAHSDIAKPVTEPVDTEPHHETETQPHEDHDEAVESEAPNNNTSETEESETLYHPQPLISEETPVPIDPTESVQSPTYIRSDTNIETNALDEANLESITVQETEENGWLRLQLDAACESPRNVDLNDELFGEETQLADDPLVRD